MQTDQGFLQRIARIEGLIARIELWPDASVRDEVRELVQALLDLHGTGLAHMIEAINAAGEPGRAVLDTLARDDLVSSLLLLHGLHPVDLETRVMEALESVRPHLHSHGGDVELLGIVDGIVRLRTQGSCHGCPSSALTLRTTIEDAVRASAPDVAAIEVEGAVDSPVDGASGFISENQLLNGNGKRLTRDPVPTRL